jgi:hypothetical protein
MLTRSENLFRDYCNLRGYVANRLSAPADGGPFPDYEVVIGTNRIVVEVKELNPNPADKNMAKIIQEERIECFGQERGRRVRTHIEDAERQLRRYESQKVPCLVVLYDNIIVDGFSPNLPNPLFPTNPLNPDHIEVGMNRTLRPGHHDNISAVATLHDHDSSYGLFLVVYHNFFAKNPLPKSVFTDSKDRQIEKPGHPDSSPGRWQRVQI